MNRAKVDTQRDERAKRESQIVITAERAAREEKTARLKALRLAAQAADQSRTESAKPARLPGSPKAGPSQALKHK